MIDVPFRRENTLGFELDFVRKFHPMWIAAETRIRTADDSDMIDGTSYYRGVGMVASISTNPCQGRPSFIHCQPQEALHRQAVIHEQLCLSLS